MENRVKSEVCFRAIRMYSAYFMLYWNKFYIELFQ